MNLSFDIHSHYQGFFINLSSQVQIDKTSLEIKEALCLFL